MLKVKFFEEKAGREIFARAEKAVSEKTARLIKESDKKTAAYCGLSLWGLLLLAAPFPKTLPYILFFGILFFAWAVWISYLLWGALRALMAFVSRIDSFEKDLSAFVRREAQSAKEESLAKRASLLASGLSEKDIENLIIACAVRALASQFKKMKKMLLIRAIALIVPALLLQKIVIGILSGLAGF